MLKVSEIFYSIQGEGTYVGKPSIFVRLVGCNLKCCYCDSAHALFTGVDDDYHTYSKMSVDEVLYKIQNMSDVCDHVIITGGEPMLNPVDIIHLIKWLKKLDYIITIETNGTLFNSLVKPHLWSISPKTSNSINDDTPKYHIENNKLYNLPNFIKSGIDCQFKFVICGINDLPEINKLITQYEIPKKMVYLMPEGYTKQSQRDKTSDIVDICKQYGYNLCPRVHIYIWGMLKGV